MARGSLARRLVVVGAVVYVARWAVTQAEPQPLPIEDPEELPDAAVASAVVAAPIEAPPRARRSTFRKRFAVSLAFATLFFAGATLSAGAGNELAQVDAASTDPAAVAAAVPVTDATTTAATTDATTTDATTTDATTTTTAVTTPDTSTTTAATTTTAAATTTAESDALTVTSATPVDTPVPASAPAAKPVQHTTAPKPVARVVAKAKAAPAAAAPAVMPAIPYAALAFDPQAWLQNNLSTPAGASAVAIAEHYLGVPYVWGGAEPDTGFDCSGLTQFVYAQLGVSLPHYAAAQFAMYPKLDPTQLEPGDLVFFEPEFDGPGHVAIYIGDDQIVEAPHTGALIQITSFSGTAAALGFMGAVRPDGAVPAPVPQDSPVGMVLARLA